MEIIDKISELTKEDSFLIAVSVRKGKEIETQCVTNNFAFADIPVASEDINKNIRNLAVEKPSTPKALQDEDPNDVVVYAEGEEE